MNEQEGKDFLPHGSPWGHYCYAKDNESALLTGQDFKMIGVFMTLRCSFEDVYLVLTVCALGRTQSGRYTGCRYMETKAQGLGRKSMGHVSKSMRLVKTQVYMMALSLNQGRSKMLFHMVLLRSQARCNTHQKDFSPNNDAFSKSTHRDNILFSEKSTHGKSYSHNSGWPRHCYNN